MPRDEQSRRTARRHARIALITCVMMLAALTPVVAALNEGTLSVAKAQPDPDVCTIIDDPTGELCTPTPASSASASRSPSASASRSPSSPASPSSGTTSPSPTPSRTPGSSPTSPSPSASRTPQTFNSPSDITIKHRKGTRKFFGKVTSDFDECEPGRRVSLFYVVPGFETSRKAGKAKTNSKGGWKVTKKNPSKGEYYASVKARRINTATGDTINCRRDRSKRVKA